MHETNNNNEIMPGEGSSLSALLNTNCVVTLPRGDKALHFIVSVADRLSASLVGGGTYSVFAPERLREVVSRPAV